MDSAKLKARTPEIPVPTLLELANVGNLQSLTASRGATDPRLSANVVLYNAISEALAISEDIHRFMRVERGHELLPDTLSVGDYHFQSNGNVSKQ
jgi:hypothetical protein